MAPIRRRWLGRDRKREYSVPYTPYSVEFRRQSECGRRKRKENPGLKTRQRTLRGDWQHDCN